MKPEGYEIAMNMTIYTPRGAFDVYVGDVIAVFDGNFIVMRPNKPEKTPMVNIAL